MDSGFFGGAQREFIRVFENEVNADSQVGIFHQGIDSPVWSHSGYYIIGNHKISDGVEITLYAGDMYLSLLGGGPSLLIGLNCDSNDRGFQPLASEQLKRLIESKGVRGTDIYFEAFPLLSREYGAMIRLKGLIKHIVLGTELTNNIESIDLYVKDEGGLEDIAKRLHQELLPIVPN